MARKLKSYQTSLGFFDLAIAAPSMKAALEAWGADSNLFHQGAAKESDDPQVVAATLKKPGVVLRRAVGSDGPFSEHAELPTNLGGGNGPRKSARKPAVRETKKRPVDEREERRAALAYEQERKSRERERLKEEAARQKEQERRKQAVAKAQAALDEAEREHDKRTAAIQAEAEALEKKSSKENDRWERERTRLAAALRRARG